MTNLMPEKKKQSKMNEDLVPRHDELVAIGRVIKAKGLRGELKIESLSDSEHRFDSLESVFLEQKNGLIVTRTVETTKSNGTTVIIKLKDIDDRTTAEAYHGGYIYVDRKNIAPLPQDSYYIFELEGMDVLNTTGYKIGKVMRVDKYPANDVIIVSMEKEDIMIPAVKHYILSVNNQKNQMTVDIPEGLPVYPKGIL